MQRFLPATTPPDGPAQPVQAVILVDPTTGAGYVAGGGGGGGGAVTIADGANVVEGSKADAPATNATGSWSIRSMLGGIWNQLAGALQTIGYATTSTSSITRLANTTAYAANQILSDSASAGNGSILAGAARIAGKSGVMTDIVVASSNDPAAPLQGEIWIFDGLVSAPADGASFALGIADRLKLVAVVPFTLSSVNAGSGASGSVANVQALNVGFTTAGSGDLRYLVKTKNAYTPASGEVITVRAKIIQTN